MQPETLESLVGRADWKVESGAARYFPHAGGWSGRVSVSAQAKYYAVWHVAIIDPDGRARYVMQASSLAEAARVVERQVQGRVQPPE